MLKKGGERRKKKGRREEKLSSCLDFNPSGILQADLPKPPGLGHSCPSACEHLPEMHRAHSKDKFLSCLPAIFLCHTLERSDAVQQQRGGSISTRFSSGVGLRTGKLTGLRSPDSDDQPPHKESSSYNRVIQGVCLAPESTTVREAPSFLHGGQSGQKQPPDGLHGFWLNAQRLQPSFSEYK